jgi:hypothetical protein
LNRNVLGMGKEHWTQFGFQVVTFMLTIVGAAWFLAWTIGGIEATEAAGRALLSERIAILEQEHKDDANALDHVNTRLDQLQAAGSDQTLALTRLTDAVASLTGPKGRR